MGHCFSQEVNLQLESITEIPELKCKAFISRAFVIRVKQSFITFEYMDRTLKCDHSLESYLAVLHYGVVCFSLFLSL